MSKEKVSLKACEGIVSDKGAAYLLHALLTTNWADERIFAKKGLAWVDVCEHLWSAYADQNCMAAAYLFINELLEKAYGLPDDEWGYIRPTQQCLNVLGLTSGNWFSN
jgi:hypothetical protein